MGFLKFPQVTEIIVEIIFHVEIILHILQICQLFENYEEIITIYKVFIPP